MVSGKVHTNRYLRLSAVQPTVDSGQTSTFCVMPVRMLYFVTIPPTLPNPDALDHTRFVSTGSGVAQPLSPPPTVRHMPLVMLPSPSPFTFALLGPIADGPSCRFPYTLYGMRLSTVTWYICAIGSWTWAQLFPRFVVMLTPPSWLTIIRSPLPGSIQMSWWSPPGTSAFGGSMIVRPPSSVFAHDAVAK